MQPFCFGYVDNVTSSKQYVNTILSSLPEGALHLSSPVASVSSTPRTDSDGFDITLTTLDGATEIYDHIIFACHSDDALKIMSAGGGVTREEERILGGFRWSRNEVIVHSDEIVRACTDVFSIPTFHALMKSTAYASE